MGASGADDTLFLLLSAERAGAVEQHRGRLPDRANGSFRALISGERRPQSVPKLGKGGSGWHDAPMKTSTMQSPLRALALLLTLASGLTARAADTWTTPFPGVRLLHRTTTSPKWDMWVAEVNLDEPGMKLNASPYAQKGKRTSSAAQAVGASLGINGDFFNYSGYIPSGLTVSSGRAWPGTADTSGRGTLQFSADLSRTELTPARTVVRQEAWMHGVISGRPTLAVGGAQSIPSGSFCTTRHPRTALGIKGRKLLMLVVDGRQSRSVGMTCAEIARTLTGLGATDILNMDGGGSSTMWVKGKGVVNRPSDGSERVVSNHLLVFPPSSSVPTGSGTLKGKVTKSGASSTRIAGATVKLSNGATYSTGTQGDYKFTPRAGTYTVTVSAPGYQSTSARATVASGGTRTLDFALKPVAGPIDADRDGKPDDRDNCPQVSNADQADLDGDGLGDACDGDDDGDNIFDEDDNCPRLANTDQPDVDKDGQGDVCDTDDDNDGVHDITDNCALVANSNQGDRDGDGQGDLCDGDDDGDGLTDDRDNCPQVSNAGQADMDDDGQGDVCDEDDDGDGADDAVDNCPTDVNANQADRDGDGRGDLCDPDDDGDGLIDTRDNCPFAANADQRDSDRDGTGDLCDPDDDNDGVADAADTCPITSGGGGDRDRDGLGDACDDDDDGDGIGDELDFCPNSRGGDVDNEGDGVGDVCDADDDNDDVVDNEDVCPLVTDFDQADLDRDGKGDACDSDDDGDGTPDGQDPCVSLKADADIDQDGTPDACDDDRDGDTVPNGADNCPEVFNLDQVDADEDGLGDACDETPYPPVAEVPEEGGCAGTGAGAGAGALALAALLKRRRRSAQRSR